MAYPKEDAAKSLLEHAVALRGASPDNWAGFLASLDAYANNARDTMLSQGGDALVRSQGAAISLSKLHELLVDAPTKLAALKNPPQTRTRTVL